MYLYFDKMGNLKEQINDEALRQGNSNINKLYVFWEKAVNNANITALWARFKADSNTYYPSSTTWMVSTTTTTETIPYDKNRDLKFFNYFTEYRFYVVTLPDEVLGESGSWLGTLQFVETNAITTLGQLAFFVSESNASVEADENINIAQWNYLLEELSEIEGTISNFGDDYVTIATDQVITGRKTLKDDLLIYGDDGSAGEKMIQVGNTKISGYGENLNGSTDIIFQQDVASGTHHQLTLPKKTGTLATTDEIPTKTSDLTNDSGYITTTSLTDMVETDSTLTEDKIIVGDGNKKVAVSNYSINDIVNTAGGNCSAYSTDLYPLTESSKCVIFGKVSITTKTLASVVLDDTTNTLSYIVANNTTAIWPTSDNDYHYLYLVYLDINMAEPDYYVYDSIDLNNCNVGDIFYTTDLGYPDYWLQIKPNNELGLDFKLSQLETSTPNLSGYVPTTRKVNNKALSSDITLDATDVGAVSNPMTTQDDIIIGGSSGTPSRLPKGNNNELLGVNNNGNLAYTKGLPYITTAPTGNNTNGGLIIVVLDSEPSAYYDGYYYIITAPQVTLISFTIGINTYQAEDGMTWEQWVASAYNTNGWQVENTRIVNSAFTNYVIYGGVEIAKTDEIVADRSYSTAVGGGGSN